MGELLAWDGVWSLKLIELMLPVAVQAEADQARQEFGAVSAAIAGAFQKGGAKPFLEALDKVRAETRRTDSEARSPRRSTASQMLEILSRLGMRRT